MTSMAVTGAVSSSTSSMAHAPMEVDAQPPPSTADPPTFLLPPLPPMPSSSSPSPSSALPSPSLPSSPSPSSSSPMPIPPPPPPPPPTPTPSVDVAALFEAQRPIRTPLPPSHSLTIPIRLLNSELTCVVCLGILRHTTAVTFCLHRFCHSCITKSLRFGKKECPQCRVGCPSHRNLRADPVFDAIIAAIYPDLEGAEEAQEKAIEAMIDAANVTQFAESAMKGARIQAERAKERAAQQKRQQEQLKVEAEERRRKAENTAWIRLLPLPPRGKDEFAPSTLALVKPHVKTTKAVTVELLCLYVRGKLELRMKEQQQMSEERKEEGGTDPSSASASSSSSPTAPLAAPSPSSAVSLRVSLWFRWSDMTDLARRVWTQDRAAAKLPLFPLLPRPSTPPATLALLPASTAGSAPPSAAPSTSSTSSSPPSLPSDAAVIPNGSTAQHAATVASPAVVLKRARERVVRPLYPVWCEGLLGREDAPDFVELGGPTTARFLYERHWDERRANAGAQQQLLVNAAPWKKLTLYYGVEELDEDGRPAKRPAVAVPAEQQHPASSSDASSSTLQTAAHASFPAANTTAVSPTSPMADTPMTSAWSPSGAASTSAEALLPPLPASTAALIQML